MSKRLGQYELGDAIGRGGYATVYRAHHIKLQTEVALKVITPALAADPQTRQRFIQEAQTASQLEHPHIVRIFDLDEDEAQVFIAMEYLPGGNLNQWLEIREQVAWRDALPLLEQVAGALDYAHQQNVWHRDVKPSNILLDEKGNAQLTDFGLARVMDAPRLTQVGSVVGTPTYVAPEQAEDRQLSPQTDQYSLAIIAYEILVGRPPFLADTPTALSLMHVTQQPPSPSSQSDATPFEVDDVLLRALAKEPEARFPTCTEFVQALEAALTASEQRRVRQHLQEAQRLFAEGQYDAMGTQLTAVSLLLPHRPEMQESLAQLTTAREQAEMYQLGVKNWRAAQQQAQNVLDLFPDYPDPDNVFPTLKLRAAPRRRRTAKEWTVQLGVALLVGVPLVALFLYFMLRWAVGT